MLTTTHPFWLVGFEWEPFRLPPPPQPKKKGGKQKHTSWLIDCEWEPFPPKTKVYKKALLGNWVTLLDGRLPKWRVIHGRKSACRPRFASHRPASRIRSRRTFNVASCRGQRPGRYPPFHPFATGKTRLPRFDYPRVDLNPGVGHYPQKGKPWVQAYLGVVKSGTLGQNVAPSAATSSEPM